MSVRNIQTIQTGIGSGAQMSILLRDRFTVDSVPEAVKCFAIDVVADRRHRAVAEYGVHAGRVCGTKAVGEFVVGLRRFTVLLDWKNGGAEDVVVPTVCPAAVVEFRCLL